MGLFGKRKVEPAKRSGSTTIEGKINEQSHIITFEPRSYEETQFVADHLKSKRAVVVNLHRLPEGQVRRVTDFLSGVIYTLDGAVESLGPKMYLFTPDSMSVGKQQSTEE